VGCGWLVGMQFVGWYVVAALTLIGCGDWRYRSAVDWSVVALDIGVCNLR
jgi:hypothetical protein